MHLFPGYGNCPAKNLRPHKCQKEPASFPRTPRTEQPSPRLGHFAGAGALSSVWVTHPPHGGQARARRRHRLRGAWPWPARPLRVAPALTHARPCCTADTTRRALGEPARKLKKCSAARAACSRSPPWSSVSRRHPACSDAADPAGAAAAPWRASNSSSASIAAAGRGPPGPGAGSSCQRGCMDTEGLAQRRTGSERATPALEEIKSRRAPPLRPRGRGLQGARVPTRPRPLGTARSPRSPPPRPAWAPAAPAQSPDSAAPPRRGAGGVRLGPRGLGIGGDSGDSSPRERGPPSVTPGRAPSPTPGPSFSPLQLLRFGNCFSNELASVKA